MDFLFNGPDDAGDIIVLAHGAGGPMDSGWMNVVAEGLATEGIRVARFEFPYMAARRTGGKRGAPDRPAVLMQTWKDAAEALGGGARLVIGGKSMGGRIASMVADEIHARGLVCMGYPFHPPGQLEKLRVAHLESLQTPTLIVQGERDMFGTRAEIGGYPLSPSIRMEWMTDGDHSFKPRKSSGESEASNRAHAIRAIATFVRDL